MAIPLKYNLRNLLRRKARTALTAAGMGVTVFVVVLTLGLVEGMWESVNNTAATDNIILLSRKGQTAIQSQIEGTDAALLETLPHLRRGGPADLGFISPELMYMISVTFDEHPEAGRFNAMIRGIDPEVAFLVHDQVRVAEEDRMRGVEASGGDGALLVGRNAFIRLGVPAEWLEVGKVLWFGPKPPDPSQAQGKLFVAGRLDAAGSAFETEIWTDLEFLKSLVEVSQISTITLKVDKPENVRRAIEAVHGTETVKLDAVSERAYYASYYESLSAATIMIIIISLVVCAGGIFVGMNTMYTAVMGRIREIGTLKVLGFRGTQILASFLIESAMVSGVAGLLGTASAALLPMLYADFGAMSIFQTSFSFGVSPLVAATGVGTGVLMGVFGAFPPALKGVRMKVVDALRHA